MQNLFKESEAFSANASLTHKIEEIIRGQLETGNYANFEKFLPLMMVNEILSAKTSPSTSTIDAAMA